MLNVNDILTLATVLYLLKSLNYGVHGTQLAAESEGSADAELFSLSTFECVLSSAEHISNIASNSEEERRER